MEYILGYAIDSETLLEIGVILMRSVILFTVLIFIQVVIKRATLVYQEKRRQKFLDLWRPILMESVATTPDSLPKLDKNFIYDFVSEWNTLYEKLGGVSHDNLIALADKVGLGQYALSLLVSKHIKLRLTGVITLGNMRAEKAWEILSSISKSSETILSMAAYRALAQINMDRALMELLPKLIKRLDWPPSMVAKILKDTKSTKVCELLADASMTADDNALPNIVKYINVLNCSNSTHVFRHLLEKKVDDQIISLCLHELKDPTAIDIARRFVDYPRWHVRVNAAHALGNIGGPDDITHLKKLLNDRQWWVRYRAAQAIVKMPFIDEEALQKISHELESEKAKQILDQAVAEKEL